MSILEIIGIIIGAILVINTYCGISIIISNVGKYFGAKAENVKAETLLKREEKINISRNYIDMIDYIIGNEIARILQTYVLLRNRYETLQIDEDLEQLASTIYNGLKKDFLQDDSIIFTEEYMMKYITERCRLLLFNSVTEYNSSLRMPIDE